jgi:hypothetical protein
MKRFLLLMVLAVSVQIATAQDYKKVQIAFTLNKFEDAKTEVDKLVADPKAQPKAETWYWKAAVYSELAASKDAALQAKYPNAYKEAAEALKKYQEMDPTFAVVKANSSNSYFNMYSASYQQGVKAFNEKTWAASASAFEAASAYLNTIIVNKWTPGTIAFDTTAVLYTAFAYYNDKKLDEAARNYKILADGKVGGDNFLDVYKFLLVYSIDKKDEAQFKKYLATAKELYPKEAWDEYEVDYMDKNLTLEQKAAFFDKQDAAGALTEMQYLQFGDLFIKAKSSDKLDSAKQKEFTLKAADAFKKAYGKNTQNAIAAFNVGVIYYNVYVEYDDQYAGNIRAMQALNQDRPVEKDPKKKAAADAALKAKVDPIREANTKLEKPLMENLDASVEWLEKSYTILKDKANRDKTDKSVINKSVDFLANLYAYKRDRVRGKDSKAFDAYDAKYKEFDALHSKF